MGIDEPGFIAALRAIAADPAARGLADDAAVLEFGGESLVLTHDMMVEGVHWLPDQDPADVAWKLVAANLSDLAAKGAEPLGVLLGYTLGGDEPRFLAGLGEVLAHHGVPLLGGDTVSGHGRRTHGITAIGRASHRPVPSRSGAQAGDSLWLTGPVGAAMLGYEALRGGTGGESLAFRRPQPRLAEGVALAQLVTAMMDVSDGLLLDAARLARASGATAALISDAVPLAPGLREAGRSGDAMRWGDDYELLFTLPPSVEPPVAAWQIGEVRPAGDASLLLDGKPLPDDLPLGYLHDTPR